jgi:hypothetical protein
VIPVKVISRIILGIAAVAVMLLTAVSPASAQLSPACTCPAGSVPTGLFTCFRLHVGSFAATCPATAQSIAQIAASQQQLSFWGVQQILQSRRDQLQGTLGASNTTSPVSSYAEPDVAETFGALGYSSQSQGSNPLAPFVYKAPPAPAPTSTGPAWAVWTQGLGDWEHRDPISSTDLGRYSQTYAAQAGVDATWRGLAAADDALVVGVVGSWLDTHVITDQTATRTDLQGSGIGLYGTYVKGGFSTDMTTKFDFLQLVGGGLPSSVDLTNAGVSGNAQYKQNLTKNAFVEPTGGFSFTRALFGSGATADGLTDASTLRLQAGARWGASWTINGVSVEPTLKTLVYSNVIAQGSGTIVATAPIVPTDQGKVRGELDPGVNLDFGHGYSGSLSGQIRFGEGLIGGSANINIRKQW